MLIHQWASAFADVLETGNVLAASPMLDVVSEEAGNDYSKHLEEDLPEFIDEMLHYLHDSEIPKELFISILRTVSQQSKEKFESGIADTLRIYEICNDVFPDIPRAVKSSLLVGAISKFIFSSMEEMIAKMLGIDIPNVPPPLTDDECNEVYQRIF